VIPLAARERTSVSKVKSKSPLAAAIRRSLWAQEPFTSHLHLLEAAVTRIVSALAPSTVSSYGTGPRAYTDYALAHSLDPSMPPSRPRLIGFVTYRADFYLSSHGSIRGYLAGLKFLCRSLGVSTEAFGDTQLELLLRSVKRDRGARPRPPPVFQSRCGSSCAFDLSWI
jgi:hypothetical protein